MATCGRRATCLAWRIRNQRWPLLVRLGGGWTDWDSVDDYWLPEINKGHCTDGYAPDTGERPRFFEGLYHQGRDPSAIRGVNTKYLMEVVHADPRMASAKAMFESPLWDLLSAPPGSGIPRQADLEALGQRWDLAQLLSLSQALTCLLHGRRVSLAHRELLLMHAHQIDSLVLLRWVQQEQGAGLDVQQAVRYAHTAGFLLYCIQQRWLEPDPWPLAHLVMTRLIEPQDGPWREHELAWGGFPIRPRHERTGAHAPKLITPVCAPYSRGELQARVKAGYVATCVELAACTGERLPDQGPDALRQAYVWHITRRPHPVSPPALMPLPISVAWGVGRFRPRQRKDQANRATRPAAMPAWPMDDQVSHEGRFLPR